MVWAYYRLASVTRFVEDAGIETFLGQRPLPFSAMLRVVGSVGGILASLLLECFRKNRWL
jgi:hypothetical protein